MRQAKVLIGLDDPQTALDILLFSEVFFRRVSGKWDLDKGACIAAACISTDVFRRLGYKTRPLPVIVVGYNRQQHERRLAGEIPDSYTHLVIGDPRDRETAGRWKGHVACLAHHPARDQYFILDASLRQAQRDYLPHMPDLVAMPFVPGTDHFGERKQDVLVGGCDHDSGNTTISYYLRTGDGSASWTESPDARRERRRVTVDRMVTYLTRERRSMDIRDGDLLRAVGEACNADRWEFLRTTSEAPMPVTG